MAEAAHRSITRRSLVAGAAAVPAAALATCGAGGPAAASAVLIASAPALPTAALAGGMDVVLAALAQRFAAGLVAVEAAGRSRAACEQRYFAAVPDAPAELGATDTYRTHRRGGTPTSSNGSSRTRPAARTGRRRGRPRPHGGAPALP
jgi:hypothetical protein